ncbi:MAG: hypothetical protein M0022_05740 [Desulfobacteraceae bacterium]|nr:hypothetical protein [Desulfobacteraceae bacterium]
MDWQFIIENLKTGAILSRLNGMDPLALARNPYVSVPFFVVLAVLIFFKMVRTVATITSVTALWFAIVYALPRHADGPILKDIGVFSGICIVIFAVLIYVYLIRSD